MKYFVIGAVVDEKGNVVGTARSTTPASLPALQALFRVQQVNGPAPTDAPRPDQKKLFSSTEAREDPVAYVTKPCARSASRRDPSRPPSAAAVDWQTFILSIDKTDPDEADVLTGLKLIGVVSCRYIARKYGVYRCARVLRAAAVKNGKLEKPAAWVLAALTKDWDVDEDS